MGTFFVGIIVLALIVLAARSVYNSKKNGDVCGCGCAGCPKSVDQRQCGGQNSK